jgi:hypothetical protein
MVTRFAPPGFKAQHRTSSLIADLLMASHNKEIMRFMLSMPPGHCKSTHSSHHFPAWWFGKNPKKKFLQAGHSSGLRGQADRLEGQGDRRERRLPPGVPGHPHPHRHEGRERLGA